MLTLIKNATLLHPYRSAPGWLLINGGRIEALGAAKDEPAADRVLDAGGLYLSPGFMDLHTHGGGGHDFMDGTVDAVVNAALAHMQYGTTALYPTTLTCADEELLDFFEVYRAAKAELEGPELMGIHLEGPYFAPEQAGAQDPAYLKTPAPEHFNKILEAGGADIARLSAAVELEGAEPLGRALRQRGILGSIAHSNAEYDQVLSAFDWGFTHITHLYSAMSTIRRINAHRHLGVVESAYLIDEMTAEIIADGKHLPPELLRLIVRCKPLDKLVLVTDSMRGAGMPPGERVKLGSLAHGQDTIIEDGVAYLLDRSAFAGSVCTADRCVRTMHQLAGLPLVDAVRMMTRNPAVVMGVAHRKGGLLPGMDADLCLFDEGVQIKAVFCRGAMTVNRL